MTERLDCATIAAMLAERMPDLAREMIGAEPTSRGVTEWRFRRKGSLAVVVAGRERGSWFDHEAGEGGDALGLVAHIRRSTMGDALAWARAWLGLGRGDPPPRLAAPPFLQQHRERQAPDTLNLARRLWREGAPAGGTLVERYLASRELALPDDPAVLRFHPRAWRNRAFGPSGPAMLALMTHPSEHRAGVCPRPAGVHVTYLRPDGGGKAGGERTKIMLGGVGVIRLVEDAEVTLGLGLAEGVETALSVMQWHGWRPVWAATSAGAIRTFPVLPGLEALTIFADMDDSGAGIEAARACAARWHAAGREARITAAPPGCDFNDVPGSFAA